MQSIRIESESEAAFGAALEESNIPPSPFMRVITDFAQALRARGYDVQWKFDVGKTLMLVYAGVSGADLVAVDVPKESVKVYFTHEFGPVLTESPEALRDQFLGLIRDKVWRQRLEVCRFLAEAQT
jgi:hypothetical protein